jgi:hypothetical protein
MKKLLVLITAMVAVFGFSAGAFAAWGDPICTTCKGCPVGNIPCNIEEQAEDDCADFDYDSFVPSRHGYCSTNSANCRAIFNICNCETPSVFDAGATIGIRMTVLVDGVAGQLGAYWAEDATDLALKTFDGVIPEDPCADVGQLENFGLIDFFKADRISGATPLASSSCDPIIAANQAVVLVSEVGEGYVIDATDVTEKRHKWWIDILPIRIDRNVLHDGELISVKIELLAEGSGGICAECDAVCECIIDVAYVCCTVAAKSIYFPYVLPGSTSWSTGIVVTNLSSTIAPADMVATFTLTDSTGAKFTYVKSDFTTVVWSAWLNDILPMASSVRARCREVQPVFSSSLRDDCAVCSLKPWAESSMRAPPIF